MDAGTVFMVVIATTADALTGADTVTGTEPKSVAAALRAAVSV
jgi:hypothetical protein